MRSSMGSNAYAEPDTYKCTYILTSTDWDRYNNNSSSGRLSTPSGPLVFSVFLASLFPFLVVFAA
jgi:hypothetical protein